MPAYDATQFDPPAPLAPVALRNPDNGAIQSDVPMLLDSGADVTLIPQTAVDVLEAVIVPDRQDGQHGLSPGYKVTPAASCSRNSAA